MVNIKEIARTMGMIGANVLKMAKEAVDKKFLKGKFSLGQRVWVEYDVVGEHFWESGRKRDLARVIRYSRFDKSYHVEIINSTYFRAGSVVNFPAERLREASSDISYPYLSHYIFSKTSIPSRFNPFFRTCLTALISNNLAPFTLSSAFRT